MCWSIARRLILSLRCFWMVNKVSILVRCMLLLLLLLTALYVIGYEHAATLEHIKTKAHTAGPNNSTNTIRYSFWCDGTVLRHSTKRKAHTPDIWICKQIRKNIRQTPSVEALGLEKLHLRTAFFCYKVFFFPNLLQQNVHTYVIHYTPFTKGNKITEMCTLSTESNPPPPSPPPIITGTQTNDAACYQLGWEKNTTKKKTV